MKIFRIVFRAAALFAILQTNPFLAAQVINGSDGILMGGTGRVTNAPIIEDFSVYAATESWLYPNGGYANVIAPVGQFTGFNDDGTPIAYLDLVPLRTSSITVVDSAANTIFSAGPDGIDFGSIMSVDSNNVLSLFKSDGTTSGISFNPNSGQINLSSASSSIYAGGQSIFGLDSTGSVIFGSTRSLSIANSTPSFSSSTGGLTVAGGIGVGKDSYFNGVRVGRGGGDYNLNTAVGSQALQSNVATWGTNSAFGSYSLSANNYGTSNSAFGSYSLSANTYGSGNSAFGENALKAAQYGSYNTAIGADSMSSFNSYGGGNNTAVGAGSLASNLSGERNVAVGSGSLASTLGSNNVALGANAGRYQGATGTTTMSSSNSIYIGADSRGASGTNQNSIVIGTSAVGEGANTTVIGNSATIKTHLYGDVHARVFKANSTTGDALIVDGGTLLNGKVVLSEPQGDISMGIYGPTE